MGQLDKDRTVNQTAAKAIDRRMVIRTAGVVGVGVLGAATLTACGGGSGESTPIVKPTSGARTIKTSRIPLGGGLIIPVKSIVVTQPKAGEFKAFSCFCTHKGCTVSDIADGTINCECHGSKFDLATGKVTHGPAVKPLPSKTITVIGDTITIP
jgi:Rieske Fe-S protein